MHAPDGSLRLQQVADYRTVKKTLRTSATISVVMGAITLLFALVPPASGVAAALGLVLLGAGSWNLARPRPTGILVDGASIIVVGLFNIVGEVLALQGGGGGSGFWIKVGVFQLVFGGQAFWRYARFRDAFASPASDSELRQLDGMVTTMWKTKVKDATDVIEFTTTGFHAAMWKGRLTETGAVLATDGGREVRVAARDEFDIAEQGKVLIGKSLKATITIRGKAAKGTIPPESYERFQQWRTGVIVPRAIAA